RVLVRIGAPVVLHVRAQRLGKPRVVAPVRLDLDGVRMRIRPAEKLIYRVGRLLRVPSTPDLGAGLAKRRRQEIPRSSRQLLPLLDEGDVEILKRLDRIGRVILHALEDDHAAAGRPDFLVHDAEIPADAVSAYLVLDQQLRREAKRALRLAHAHRAQPRERQRVIDEEPAEESRFAGAATAMRALVARAAEAMRLEQRHKDFGRRDVEDAHSFGDAARTIVRLISVTSVPGCIGGLSLKRPRYLPSFSRGPSLPASLNLTRRTVRASSLRPSR